jgi:hypothetical protein
MCEVGHLLGRRAPPEALSGVEQARQDLGTTPRHTLAPDPELREPPSRVAWGGDQMCAR